MTKIELTDREKKLVRHGYIVGVVLGFITGFYLCLTIIHTIGVLR